MSAWIAFSLLMIIATAHSVVGEIVVVGPLLRDDRWRVEIPRARAAKVVRFAWHLTTIAWAGLAAIVAGASVGVTFGIVCLASAAVIFVMARWHFAWPVFLAAGLYGLDVAGSLPRAALGVGVGLAVVIAAGGAILHIAWALGSSWGGAHAVPEDPETSAPVFEPGRVATLAVAGASATLAGLLSWVTWGPAPSWAWWLVVAAAVATLVRVLGDFKDVGMLKKVRGTRFAELDDAIYTPLFVALAFGAIAALHLAGSPL